MRFYSWANILADELVHRIVSVTDPLHLASSGCSIGSARQISQLPLCF